MSDFLKVFNVTDGVIASEVTPDSQEGLYASPQELGSLFGCMGITEADIRFAMGLIHSHCNRASLWPTEVLTPTIEIPYGQQETRLHITPIIDVLEVAGRYGPGRRDRQATNNPYTALNPLLILVTAGAPIWTPIPLYTLEYDASTGIVTLPWSNMLLPYSIIRVRYIGGYLNIPFRVKAALAELINSTHAKQVSDRRRMTSGRITREFVSDSFMTPQAEQFLQPFVIRALF
jgi:hypothetical protein